jgi:hypothetical protein
MLFQGVKIKSSESMPVGDWRRRRRRRRRKKRRRLQNLEQGTPVPARNLIDESKSAPRHNPR